MVLRSPTTLEISGCPAKFADYNQVGLSRNDGAPVFEHGFEETPDHR
jgi:hypothetical protein